jgi:hypothetical protein
MEGGSWLVIPRFVVCSLKTWNFHNADDFSPDGDAFLLYTFLYVGPVGPLVLLSRNDVPISRNDVCEVW